MALWEFGTNKDAAGRALLLAAALLDGPSTRFGNDGDGGDNRNAPFGWRYRICGVGLFADSQNEATPALFIERPGNIKELSSQHWSVVPEARAGLRDAFGENLEWIGNTQAVSVGRTSLQADPGDLVHVPGEKGELGAPVYWGTEKGYLTAGHVGQSVKAQADDGHGRNIGTVVYVRTASAIQPQGCAGSSVDVAVVKLNSNRRHGTLGIVSAAVPSPRDRVEVHTQKGVQTARIFGAARWWYVSASGVTMTEIYLSDTGVTQPGDSGGPVLLKGVKGQIIGHIVAGGTSTSCFQDIGHQLSEIRKDPNFQTIRI